MGKSVCSHPEELHKENVFSLKICDVMKNFIYKSRENNMKNYPSSSSIIIKSWPVLFLLYPDSLPKPQ